MADISRWNPFAELAPLQRAFFGEDWPGFGRDEFPVPAAALIARRRTFTPLETTSS